MSAILIHDTPQKVIVLEWRALSQRFIDRESANGDVGRSVSWIKMADTLNTGLTNCLYCKTGVGKRYIGQGPCRAS